MTEFKQIIGCGTRVREDHGKMFFTIIDFRNAWRLFYDPLFDGDPVQVYEPKPVDEMAPPDEAEDTEQEQDIDNDAIPEATSPDIMISEQEDEGDERPRKYYVSGVSVEIVAERAQYYDSEKGLVSASLKDYSKQNLRKAFVSLDDFIQTWNRAEQKEAIVAELAEQGVLLKELQRQVGKELDAFDLICHVAFDMPPLSRHERANNVKKKNYFAKYGPTAQKVLEAPLDKYADEGIAAVEGAFERAKIINFLMIPPFSNLGMPVQLINGFGGKDQYIQAIRDLEQQIYSEA